MRPAWLAIAVALAACTSSLPNYEARVHVVRPGETLYSIAWRYNVAHTTLARWNGLDNPDLIFAGQRLRLAPSVAAAVRPTPPPSQPAATGPRPAPAVSRAVTRDWQWPTDGRIVTSFGSPTAIPSGVGIGGRIGQPVRAAAAGRVVYAGSGLIGYGQLIIVKHDETYLSAYGYNDRVLVAQGDDVRRGQRIGDMGRGPDREPRLHFEIRRDGTPVNPLQFVAPP